MKSIVSCFIFFLMVLTLSAQSNRKRDAIKVGYTQVYLGQDGLFKPGAYLEYTRLFYPPLYLGVGASFTQAKGIESSQAIRDLISIGFDLTAHYAFLNTDQNQVKLGLGLSARLFETNRLERATGFTDKISVIRPGLTLGLNYDYLFEVLFVGFRGMIQTYSNNGAIYQIGGHVGFKF